MSTKDQLFRRDWLNIEPVKNENVDDDDLSNRRGRRSRPKLSWFGAWMLLIYCSIFYAAWPYSWNASMLWVRKRLPDDGGERMIYDYNDITPSEKLQWHPCFGDAKCARLTVPMDYNRQLNASKDNPKVHVALSMIPGVGHSETGDHSISPMLINPGGPGGAGASFVLGLGSHLQSIVSTDRSQDIVGFDPRGVGATTPQADCWSYPSNGRKLSNEDVKTGVFRRMTWSLLGAEVPLVNATEGALPLHDARARAVSKLCKEHDSINGENSILKHLSTPAVAQDMLSIIQAWDEWRAETHQGEEDIVNRQTQLDASSETTYSLDTAGKLVYWGFSYGTLLGATFAAMFPDRIGRVILDGVVDADYYVSPVWADSLRDTDAILEKFHSYCHEAGPLCALYRTADTEHAIKTRVQRIFSALKKEPIHGLSPYNNLPLIFTQDTLKLITFATLYSPTSSFPFLAELFSALHDRNNSILLQMLPAYYPSYQPFCDSSPSPFISSNDAQLAIMCTDKRYPLNESLPNLEARFAAIANVSNFADVWMSLMIGCDAFDVTPTDPPMRWDDHPAHRLKPINTSFPLLFLSNSRDPVTPLYAGVKMARKFVDAGLVEQRSEGHCSLAAVSRCTMEKVKAYFEEGKVPARPQWGPKGEEIEKGIWERCEAGEWPWKSFDRGDWMREFGARLENRKTIGASYDDQAALQEELGIAARMEAWKEAQKISKSFLRPNDMFGGSLPLSWVSGER